MIGVVGGKVDVGLGGYDDVGEEEEGGIDEGEGEEGGIEGEEGGIEGEEEDVFNEEVDSSDTLVEDDVIDFIGHIASVSFRAKNELDVDKNHINNIRIIKNNELSLSAFRRKIYEPIIPIIVLVMTK